METKPISALPKKRMISLYLLNVTDIIFTLLLLRTGLFTEANGAMSGVVTNPIAGLAVKLILPALLLFYLFFRLKRASPKQLRISGWVINIVLVFYGLVNLSHVLWILLLPFFQG